MTFTSAESGRESPGRDSLSRDTVVLAALDLLEADGLDGVTGGRIAEALGVSQPAIYRHIESMDAVWRDLGLVGRHRLRDELAAAAVGRAGAEAVTAVANAWRDFARTNPALYAATDRHPCADDPELEAAVEQVVEVLSMSMRSFGLAGQAAVDAGRLLRSFLHGFVHLELGDGHPHPVGTDASFDRIVADLAAMLPGLAAPIRPDPTSPDPT